MVKKKRKKIKNTHTNKIPKWGNIERNHNDACLVTTYIEQDQESPTSSPKVVWISKNNFLVYIHWPGGHHWSRSTCAEIFPVGKKYTNKLPRRVWYVYLVRNSSRRQWWTSDELHLRSGPPILNGMLLLGYVAVHSPTSSLYCPGKIRSFLLVDRYMLFERWRWQIGRPLVFKRTEILKHIRNEIHVDSLFLLCVVVHYGCKTNRKLTWKKLHLVPQQIPRCSRWRSLP